MPPRPETYCYKTIQGCALHADVYRLTDMQTAMPVVIWIHGGALVTGSRTWLSTTQANQLLDAGYIVVAIDYRLAPETKLPAIIEDLLDAYQWVREKGPGTFDADPDRIAAIGHSAGGYLTLMLGRYAWPRPCALVTFYGYGDIVGDWYTTPDPFYCRQPTVSLTEAFAVVQPSPIAEVRDSARAPFYLYCRQQGLWPTLVVGRDPAVDPEFFHRYCPADTPPADFPPTLLIHGDQDTDVPYAQSVLMAERLADAGVMHELYTVHGADHAFDSDHAAPTTQAALARTRAFLERHIGAVGLRQS